MSAFDPQEIVHKLFPQIRREFSLGMGEYFAALKIFQGEWVIKDESDLKEILQILWCNSLEDQAKFQIKWQEIVLVKETTLESSISPTPEDETIASSPSKNAPLDTSETSSPIDSSQSVKPIAALPVQPPPFRVSPTDISTPFHTHYPITRRTMAYNWRYLRRLVPEGPAEVLNIPATVKQTAQQGFFLSPVKDRKKRNHAYLLLLVDQNGSMTPFHHFVRDLVETARYESNLDPERVDVVYFHNIPAENVYQDVYLTQPVPLADVLEKCNNNSSILIVSDAGAARGYRRLPRIQDTTRAIHQIKRSTQAIVWLNPMPSDRWIGSSAQVLQYIIPMFPLNNEGFAQAIDVVRGQIT